MGGNIIKYNSTKEFISSLILVLKHENLWLPDILHNKIHLEIIISFAREEPAEVH